MTGFEAQVKMFRSDFSGMTRAFNTLFREALTVAALFWTREFLPRRFTEAAWTDLQLPSYSRRYVHVKRQALERIGRSDFPPFVFHGDWEAQILSQGYRPDARVTSTRYSVVVPIPTPHPINPKWAGQLGSLNLDELRAMQAVALEFLEERIPRAVLLAERPTRIGSKAA